MIEMQIFYGICLLRSEYEGELKMEHFVVSDLVRMLIVVPEEVEEEEVEMLLEQYSLIVPSLASQKEVMSSPGSVAPRVVDSLVP